MRTRRKAKGIGVRMLGLSMLRAKVDYCRLSMHVEKTLPLLFFSVSSVSSVPERVLRRASPVGYPCWVEA